MGGFVKMDKEFAVVIVLIILVLVVTIALIGSQVGLTGFSVKDENGASEGIRLSDSSVSENNENSSTTETINIEPATTIIKSSSSGSGTSQEHAENPTDTEKYEVDISMNSFSGKKDNEFTINIKVASEWDIYAAEFELNFNPDVLEFIEAKEGGFLSKDGVETYEVIREENGKVLFASTRFGDLEGISGEGNLAAIKFKAKEAGKSNLILENVRLADTSSDQNKFELNLKSGTATIL